MINRYQIYGCFTTQNRSWNFVLNIHGTKLGIILNTLGLLSEIINSIAVF